MKRTVLIFPLFLLIVISGCSDKGEPGTSLTTSPSLTLTQEFTLTADAEGGSARPEIAATTDRVFVAYLAHTAGDSAEKTFDVKIFDKDLSTQLSLTTIVPPSPDYGNATDIRIAKDDQSVYAFYETSTETTTYLHGAKYALNDTFDLIASPGAPIASAKPVFEASEGDEILNDPAPLVGPNSVFVATRIYSSITTTGNTLYRIREFDKTNFVNLSTFDLDLSGIADGRARVASLLYWNNSIYMALATTVSDQGANDQNHMSDDGAMCDILLVKMAPDWTFAPQTGVRTISADPDDRENYITGLRTDGVYFYLTYKQAVGSPPTGEQIAVIKVFDADFNLVYKENVTSVSWGSSDAGEIRPSLEVFGNRIYSGQSSSRSLQLGNGRIYVYEMH
jgi:hypothetical protein